VAILYADLHLSLLSRKDRLGKEGTRNNFLHWFRTTRQGTLRGGSRKLAALGLLTATVTGMKDNMIESNALLERRACFAGAATRTATNKACALLIRSSARLQSNGKTSALAEKTGRQGSTCRLLFLVGRLIHGRGQYTVRGRITSFAGQAILDDKK